MFGVGELLTNVTEDGDGVTVTDGVILRVGNGVCVGDGDVDGTGDGHLPHSSHVLKIISSPLTIVGVPLVAVNTV